MRTDNGGALSGAQGAVNGATEDGHYGPLMSPLTIHESGGVRCSRQYKGAARSAVIANAGIFPIERHGLFDGGLVTPEGG